VPPAASREVLGKEVVRISDAFAGEARLVKDRRAYARSFDDAFEEEMTSFPRSPGMPQVRQMPMDIYPAFAGAIRLSRLSATPKRLIERKQWQVCPVHCLPMFIVLCNATP
jgi:hypothetical protein